MMQISAKQTPQERDQLVLDLSLEGQLGARQGRFTQAKAMLRLKIQSEEYTSQLERMVAGSFGLEICVAGGSDT